MADLVPVIAAGLGALATVAVQLLISRGEPADLKRLSAINSVLETMPGDQPGWTDLSHARSLLAARVAQTIVAPPKTIRIIRWTGWLLAIVGIGLFVFSIALLGVLTPTGQEHAIGWMQAGLFMLLLAPAVLYFSWLWQELRGLPKSILDIFEAARARLARRTG